MLYLGIFRLEFTNIIVIYQESTLEFFEIQSPMQSKNSINFLPQMIFGGIFRL